MKKKRFSVEQVVADLNTDNIRFDLGGERFLTSARRALCHIGLGTVDAASLGRGEESAVGMGYSRRCPRA